MKIYIVEQCRAEADFIAKQGYALTAFHLREAADEIVRLKALLQDAIFQPYQRQESTR